MNITKNPNYKYVKSPNNPYLNVLTFVPKDNGYEVNLQITFLLDACTFVTDTVPYILTSDFVKNGKKQPTEFYNNIMKEVEDNPNLYNCTKKELYKAYTTTFGVMNSISMEYNANKSVNSDILKYGMTLLNDTFLDDLYNDCVDKRYFVDAMLNMSKSLERYNKKGNA